jgi:hypothetical protein
MSDSKQLIAIGEPASVDSLNAQAQVIQKAMKSVMKAGEHFGKIPGTNKPTLLKAGAEKLSVLFRLSPSYTIKKEDLPNGHREYEIICTLTHINTRDIIGQGVGICSTMESKYRWRKEYKEEVVGDIDKGYWNIPQDNPQDRDAYLVKKFGTGKYKRKKIDNIWKVVRVVGNGERVENPDIADTFNTVLKMGKKRAHVDGILTATGASDIFTQDLEELQGNINGDYTKTIEADSDGVVTDHGITDQSQSELWGKALEDVNALGEKAYGAEWTTKKVEFAKVASKKYMKEVTTDLMDLPYSALSYLVSNLSQFLVK